MCESQLHLREGKTDSNFQKLLPPEQSDLVQQALKDPYIFDFLTLTEPYQERELELALLSHIENFLLELGVGFAFVGRQYPLRVSKSEYYIDLLFYHFKLRRFVVIELKKGGFKPEYAGKLNFYCNVVDDVLRHPDDQPTVGLILCQDKNKFVAEYAFKGIDTPMGVSEYQLLKTLPKEFQSSLPTIEEIEAELGKEVERPSQSTKARQLRSVRIDAGVESGGLAADTLSLQEKSVMQYFQSNDLITVKVVGELLSVKDSRAREIVKALTEKGLLIKQGTARSTYYVRV
jgi:predicted nuclease of restriction endonuclease-like (RecB) superfamily